MKNIYALLFALSLATMVKTQTVDDVQGEDPFNDGSQTYIDWNNDIYNSFFATSKKKSTKGLKDDFPHATLMNYNQFGWPNNSYGGDGCQLTLSSSGCYLTCWAMIFASTVVDDAITGNIVDPPSFNAYAKIQGWFFQCTDCIHGKCSLAYNKIGFSDYANSGTLISYEIVSFDHSNEDLSASKAALRLRKTIDDLGWIIVEFNGFYQESTSKINTSLGDHFALIYGYTGDGTSLSDFVISDPGTSVDDNQTDGQPLIGGTENYSLSNIVEFRTVENVNPQTSPYIFEEEALNINCSTQYNTGDVFSPTLGSKKKGDVVYSNIVWTITDPNGATVMISGTQTPSYTFNIAGTYTISVAAQDGAGNFNSSITSVTVTAGTTTSTASNSKWSAVSTSPIVYPASNASGGSGCASLSMDVINCSSQNVFPTGSAVAFQVSVGNIQSCGPGPYGGEVEVGRIDWIVDNGTPSSTCNFKSGPDLRKSITFNTAGQHTIEADVYPMYMYNYNNVNNWFGIDETKKSSITKTINVVDCNNVININSNSDLSNNQLAGHVNFCTTSGSSVTLNSGTNLAVNAYTEIDLNPGFTANSGSNFNTFIAGCPSSCTSVGAFGSGGCDCPYGVQPNSNLFGVGGECYYSSSSGDCHCDGWSGFVELYYEADYPWTAEITVVKAHTDIVRDWITDNNINYETFDFVYDDYLVCHSYVAYAYVCGIVGNSTSFFSIGGNCNACLMEDPNAKKAKTMTEIPTPEIEDSVKVYPNPNNGTFTVSVENQIIKDVSVLDISGRLIQYTAINNNGGSSFTISLPNRSKGIYLIKLIGKQKTYIQKILVE